MSFHSGDKVTRKSYQHDIVFEIQEIHPGRGAVLKGIDVRLIADALLDDLQKITDQELAERQHQLKILEEESLRLIYQDRKWLAESSDRYERQGSLSEEVKKNTLNTRQRYCTWMGMKTI